MVVKAATEGLLSRCADPPGALRDIAIASSLYDTVMVVGNSARVADPPKRFEVCPMTCDELSLSPRVRVVVQTPSMECKFYFSKEAERAILEEFGVERHTEDTINDSDYYAYPVCTLVSTDSSGKQVKFMVA